MAHMLRLNSWAEAMFSHLSNGFARRSVAWMHLSCRHTRCLVNLRTQQLSACLAKACGERLGGFPKLGVPFGGVPIIRTIVYWDLYWGPPIFGKLPLVLIHRKATIRAMNFCDTRAF